jgi:hypothetical protein
VSIIEGIHMTTIEYHIWVKGHLPSQWSGLFEGMEISQDPCGDTLLSGPLKDQAALYGLLNKLQNLGVSLISVNPLKPGEHNL